MGRGRLWPAGAISGWATVEEYVGSLEEDALTIAQESLERGERYFWEHVEGGG
jgi:hypothetical protein